MPFQMRVIYLRLIADLVHPLQQGDGIPGHGLDDDGIGSLGPYLAHNPGD